MNSVTFSLFCPETLNKTLSLIKAPSFGFFWLANKRQKRFLSLPPKQVTSMLS